ncbi:hypothetical protein ISS04_01890 [Candidatus Woesearchaeota archaeon]|nr:hypothetical protein [Candidatus Woesearchaeota archaeon]
MLSVYITEVCMMKYRFKFNKSAQAVIIDFFIALSIFILLVSMIAIMWNKYHFELNQKVTQKDMWLKTYHVSDILIHTSGSPSEWENINWEGNMGDINNLIETVGLVSFDRQLDSNKVQEFVNMTNNYNASRELLNIEGYHLYFRLFDKDMRIHESGPNPILFNAERTTSVRRYVQCDEGDNRRCILEVSLWE